MKKENKLIAFIVCVFVIYATIIIGTGMHIRKTSNNETTTKATEETTTIASTTKKVESSTTLSTTNKVSTAAKKTKKTSKKTKSKIKTTKKSVEKATKKAIKTTAKAKISSKKTKKKTSKTKTKTKISKKKISKTKKNNKLKTVSLGTFKLTAYCNCSKCCGKWAGGATASGKMPKAGRTIAVDTRIIPFGTKVKINGRTYIAEDTGSAIKGNRIDVYMSSHREAMNFGVKYAKVYRVK